MVVLGWGMGQGHEGLQVADVFHHILFCTDLFLSHFYVLPSSSKTKHFKKKGNKTRNLKVG
jgi:hypothetical protein